MTHGLEYMLMKMYAEYLNTVFFMFFMYGFLFALLIFLLLYRLCDFFKSKNELSWVERQREILYGINTSKKKK